MNGGAPTTPASALRALRLDPVLVDDLALDARLGQDPGHPPVDPEIVRWARAWLVVWQGVLHAAGVIGTAPPWSVAVPLADVPSLKGDPAGTRRAEAIALLERISGRRLYLRLRPGIPGDVRRTAADTSRIRAELGWKPEVSLEQGLQAQWQWASARVGAR